jgi:Double-GTPase 2
MRFLCKECWIAHDPSTLLARCDECVARTRIRRFDPLLSRTNIGLFASASELVCRLHPTEPLSIFCGECERPVPPRAVLGERSVMAILGDTASGKTSLLWVVTDRLRESNSGGVSIRQAIGDSDDQLLASMQDILESGRTRPTPETDAAVRNFAWELTTPAGDDGHWLVAFHDAAGEVWRGLGTLDRGRYERLHRYLGLVGGVLFAIDGQRVAEGVDVRERRGVARPELRQSEAHEMTIADQLARKLRARDVPTPVAVTITKADLLWDRDECRIFREDSGATPKEIDAAVRQLLERSGRHVLLKTFEESFAPLSFFAVSAFGRDPGPRIRVEDLQPARVEEPLLSLLGLSRAGT